MTIEVPLNRGYVALIDERDAEQVLRHKWTVCLQPAASRTPHPIARRTIRLAGGKQKTIQMHRFILDAPPGRQVDHINGDSLDNRRCNLRLATNSENHRNMGKPQTNTTGFKGVYARRSDGRFVARIKHHGKCIHIGSFDTAEKAARAYDAKARELFGEFALPNFTTGGDESGGQPNAALEKFRIRWRRWVGNKTRLDRPYWTTLLDANWTGWVDKVYSANGFGSHGLRFTSSREEVKLAYLRAIDNATMDDLYSLDGLYANEKFERRR